MDMNTIKTILKKDGKTTFAVKMQGEIVECTIGHLRMDTSVSKAGVSDRSRGFVYAVRIDKLDKDNQKAAWVPAEDVIGLAATHKALVEARAAREREQHAREEEENKLRMGLAGKLAKLADAHVTTSYGLDASTSIQAREIMGSIAVPFDLWAKLDEALGKLMEGGAS